MSAATYDHFDERSARKASTRFLVCRKNPDALARRVVLDNGRVEWRCPKCGVQSAGTLLHFGVPLDWVREDGDRGRVEKPDEAIAKERSMREKLEGAR